MSGGTVSVNGCCVCQHLFIVVHLFHQSSCVFVHEHNVTSLLMCTLLQSLAGHSGIYEQEEQKLSIVGSVGPRGLILLEPNCMLVLEGGCV